MRALEVLGVRLERPENQPVVLLKEAEGGRVLPIWIGAVEASAIAMAQQGVVPPRPMTHDLLHQLIGALGHRLEQVVITGLRDGIFYAEMVFGSDVRVGARPSDAIAVALRAGCPLLAEDHVLDEAGLAVPEEDEQVVEEFREFLDHITPEDFETGAGPEEGEGPPTS